MLNIADQRFYYRLTGEKSLFDAFPRSQLHGKILVCLQTVDKDKVRRLFSYFNTPRELLNFMSKLERLQRSFYEVILGEFPQKIYFDFDNIKSKAEELAFLHALLAAIEKVLEELSYDFDIGRDLRIYSSHAKEKFSLHVVLKGYAVYNGKDNADFCRRVQTQMPSEFHHIFDNSMYSSIQQYRTLYSTKCGQDRPKILEPLIFYKGKSYKVGSALEGSEGLHENFVDSLVSHIDGALFLPPLHVEVPKVAVTQTVDVELARQAYELFLAHQSQITTYTETWVSPKEIKGGIIVLRRLCPTYCKLCDRTHDSENPYLAITGSAVFYHCRRHQRPIHIGDIFILDKWAQYYSQHGVAVVDPSTSVSSSPLTSSVSSSTSTTGSAPPPVVPVPKPKVPSPTFIDDILKGKISMWKSLPELAPPPSLHTRKEELWADLEDIPVSTPVSSKLWDDLEDIPITQPVSKHSDLDLSEPSVPIQPSRKQSQRETLCQTFFDEAPSDSSSRHSIWEDL